MPTAQQLKEALDKMRAELEKQNKQLQHLEKEENSEEHKAAVAVLKKSGKKNARHSKGAHLLKEVLEKETINNHQFELKRVVIIKKTIDKLKRTITFLENEIATYEPSVDQTCIESIKIKPTVPVKK